MIEEWRSRSMSANGRSPLSDSISLRNSSSSLWRAISSKLRRNSLAMARARPAHCPAVRISLGRSFGPTTTSATTSRMRMWLQLKRSNTVVPSAADGVLLFVGSLGVDGLGILRRVQAFAEAADALGEIAHQIGQLAAAAEQQQHDRRQDQNVPDAQATHEN